MGAYVCQSVMNCSVTKQVEGNVECRSLLITIIFLLCCLLFFVFLSYVDFSVALFMLCRKFGDCFTLCRWLCDCHILCRALTWTSQITLPVPLYSNAVILTCHQLLELIKFFSFLVIFRAYFKNIQLYTSISSLPKT